jgi:type III secretion protein J
MSLNAQAVMRHSTPRAVSARGSSILALLVAALLLSGCERKVQLQLAPDVRKASEMAAALSTHGINVERTLEKSGVMLSVADSDFSRAMSLLREAGLLRVQRPSADEALGKRGFAPTPLEERARLIHGIESELEATLMDIDGVIGARVQVVPAERPAPGAPLTPASASVFVKHRAGFDLSPLLPGMARLVKHAVPGLAGQDDRHVVVLLVSEQPVAVPREVPSRAALGASLLWLSLSLLVCGSVGVGYFADRLLRRVRRRSFKGDAGESANGATAN